MDELFHYGPKGILGYIKKNLVPILYTLIFHLVVLIILVFSKVEALKNDQELGIEVEFEEKTIEEKVEEAMVDVPADWLEEVMRQRELSSNRAVNLNAENKLDKDISTDDYVNDLLDQLEEARNEEDRERLEELEMILAAADYVPPTPEANVEQAEYAGPTTISYEFMEEPRSRGKVKLSIPVYRCQGSGLVRVEVVVGTNGIVREARVLEPIQGADKVCFGDAALEAALSSKFRYEPGGPDKHRAIITYSFIAQ